MGYLAQFKGRWRLHRVIEDHRAGTRLIFEGDVSMFDDGEGLTYRESGRWARADWGGLAATRTLLWREDPRGIGVFFGDGRPFHVFEVVRDGVSASGHDCAPDRYDVIYRFHLPMLWEADWRATGPRKDYVSRTRYDRRTEAG